MKKISILVMAFAALVCFSRFVYADPTTQVDALIEKLVEKGLITNDDADKIKGQIVYDQKTLHEAEVKKDLPQWVQDMKLSGDLRVRFQNSRRHTEDVNDVDQSIARGRWRLNLETKANDKTKVYFGIASDGGSGNARSNNYTYTSSFLKDTVVLHYAYAQYMPNDNFTILAGQMKNPIWEPMEFLWDGDITPTGAAVQYKRKVNDSLNFTLTGAVLPLLAIATKTNDPLIFVLQGGPEGQITEKVDYKIYGNFQSADNVKKNLLSGRASIGNNTLTGTQYKYSYNIPGVSVEFGLNDILPEAFPLYIPRIAGFGEYHVNPDPSNKNKAWMAGGYMGNSKINGWGTWKATGAYKVIGADSWLDVLPDSDFYSGGTDVKGYETMLELGMSKNVSFALDYYHTMRIKASKAQEHLLQADINFKF